MTRLGDTGIIGEGRLALAIAHLIAARGETVWIWVPLADRRAHLQAERRAARVLPEVERFDENVRFVDALSEVADHCRLILLSELGADPLLVLDAIGAALHGGHQVVHADHRLHGPTLETTSALLRRQTGVRQIGAAAGPLHVGELLEGKPNAAEIASAFPDLLARLRRALDFPNLRLYSSADLLGVELAAALAQIVALAIGMSDAIGAGAAAHSTLMVRGLAELRRLGVALEASPDSFNGLAGLGNLLDSARRGTPDYELGRLVSKGILGEALLEAAPPEATSPQLIPLVRAFARENDLRVPMTATLDEILAGRITPESVLAELMSPTR